MHRNNNLRIDYPYINFINSPSEKDERVKVSACVTLGGEGMRTYLCVQASYHDDVQVSGYRTPCILNLEIKWR